MQCRYGEQTTDEVGSQEVVVTAARAGRHGPHVVGHGGEDVEFGL